MRTIISASRRTDIPAHYYDWLLEGFERGEVEVTNPINQRVSVVSLRDEDVHTIVFWSKDYGNILRDLDRWKQRSVYFHFTLNDCPELEPNVPPLDERLEQMRILAAEFGPERINWRFDPLVFWDAGRRNNLAGFEPLAEQIGALGITRCTFSFMTVYRKTILRGKHLGIVFHDPPLDQKREIAWQMAATAKRNGMLLLNCCIGGLEGIDNLETGRCIDGPLLARQAGEPCSTKRDKSQRDLCGCTESRDIGSYWMTCDHACWYCYASPAKPGDNAKSKTDN